MRTMAGYFFNRWMVAKQPLGVTLTVPNGQEATGVYEAAGGVEVFTTDAPYLLSDGKSLSPPLPVKIVVGETFTDSMGNAQTALAVSGLTTPPTNTAPPTVSGTATVGETLTATPGTWSGDPAPTYSYQWQRGTADIAGATGASYTLVSADAGSTVRVVVTATNSAGEASANSASTAPVTEAPANTALPAITGIAQVGETLTATPGTWTGTPAPTYSYQWQRGTTNIEGATSSAYTLVAADAGSTVRVVVTATNSVGSASANSEGSAPVTQAPANTSPPEITGTAQVGETLTVSNGTWTGTPAPTYARQWKADGVNIAGATATTYAPVEADVGAVITCAVTATNSAGSASATSAGTSPVAAGL